MVDWNVIVANFWEVITFTFISSVLMGVFFMALIVDWGSKGKAFILSFFMTMIITTIVYLVYAGIRYYMI